jgi:uncharacterized protein YjbJ (UPF0337 family)
MGASAQNASDYLLSLICGECSIPSTALPTILNTHYQEIIMNKDQTAGRVEEVKGKVKEVAGKVACNKDLEHKGKIQNLKGQAQAGYGDLKADIKKAS